MSIKAMSFYYHILQSKSFITGGMEILSMLKDLKGKSVNLGMGKAEAQPLPGFCKKSSAWQPPCCRLFRFWQRPDGLCGTGICRDDGPGNG